MDSHTEIAEVPTEKVICNAVLNRQTLKGADIDDVKYENGKRLFYTFFFTKP